MNRDEYNRRKAMAYMEGLEEGMLKAAVQCAEHCETTDLPMSIFHPRPTIRAATAAACLAMGAEIRVMFGLPPRVE
jgi:N-dimethylarginine dimethylaminohydrolase